MSYFATCAGLQIVSGSLMIPLVGAWTADLHLATDQAVTGAVQVVIGNLTLQGFVYRTSQYGGQTSARLVGGAGGWRKTIPDQGYGSGGGVLLSHVLQDAAAACGETVNVSADRSIGPAYTRAEAPASDVLWQMVAQGFISSWYVDKAGVTQTKAWPTTTIQTPFTAVSQIPTSGCVVVATEDYAAWMPGAQFTSPLLSATYTNSGVTFNWTDDGQFRLEVMTGGTDRLLAALNALIDRKVSPTRFHGRYSYAISNPSESTIDATPNDPTLGLPELQNVPIRADSISSYVPPNGGECHIMFLDGVPTKPICVWTAGAPTAAQLLGGATPVARVGDTVQSFLPPTLPVVGDVGGSPFTGTITVLNPISGTITTGSGTVASQ